LYFALCALSFELCIWRFALNGFAQKTKNPNTVQKLLNPSHSPQPFQVGVEVLKLRRTISMVSKVQLTRKILPSLWRVFLLDGGLR
jgi:hypothetical protein